MILQYRNLRAKSKKMERIELGSTTRRSASSKSQRQKKIAPTKLSKPGESSNKKSFKSAHVSATRWAWLGCCLRAWHVSRDSQWQQGCSERGLLVRFKRHVSSYREDLLSVQASVARRPCREPSCLVMQETYQTFGIQFYD